MHHINSKHGKVTITPLFLSAFYDMPMKQASGLLGISGNTLKQVCRRQGITTWPCRELYTETHRYTNRRDVHAGRESLMLQMQSYVASYPNDQEAKLHLQMLQTAKLYAARYNLYRGNMPLDAQEIYSILSSPGDCSTRQSLSSNLNANTTTTSIATARIVHAIATPNTTAPARSCKRQKVQMQPSQQPAANAIAPSMAPASGPMADAIAPSMARASAPITRASGPMASAIAPCMAPITQEPAKAAPTKTDEMLAAIEGVRKRREERERELARLNFDATCWPISEIDSHNTDLFAGIKPDEERLEDELLLGPVSDSQLFDFFF
jgi:hypothetical protein